MGSGAPSMGAGAPGHLLDHNPCPAVPQHDVSEITWSPRKDRPGDWRWFCRACHRDRWEVYTAGRPRRGRYYGPRCINGHVKTAATWRPYGGPIFRCITCVRQRSRRLRGRPDPPRAPEIPSVGSPRTLEALAEIDQEWRKRRAVG